LNEMKVYPVVIDAEVDKYLPLLATTELLDAAIKKGMSREKAYELIKKYAIKEVLRMRETGSSENNLAKLLGSDSESPLKEDEIRRMLEDRMHFVGNAREQIYSVKEKASGLIGKYPAEASYEPKPIL